MRIFLWVLITLWILDVIGKLTVLVTGDMRRQRGFLAADVVVMMILMVWASWLLAGLYEAQNQ